MKTIIGAFDSFADARNAVDALERSGFNERDVSIVANSATTAKSAAADTTEHDRPSVGGEAMTGAMVGGLAGLVVGLAPFVIPGLGVIAAAGWLTMTLTGAAIGAGVGLVGALMGVGVPEEEAHYYNETIRRGGTLVLVRAEETVADDAARILSQHGAVDIDERAAQYRNEGFVPGAAMNTANTPNYNTADYNTTTTTPLMATTNAKWDRDTIDTKDRTTPVTNRMDADTTISVMEEQVVEVEQIPGSIGTTRTSGTVGATGVADTRGPIEKAEDFVTGDNVDDKTGQAVTGDTRNVGQKAGDALTGNRR